MGDEDVIQYFANLIAVTAVDGQLTPAETAILEQLRSEAKLTKKQFKTAQDRAAARGFAPAPVGRFSDRVKNLEEMLQVALCDGSLGDAERSLLELFSSRSELTRDQFSRILSEAEAWLAALSTATCPKCGAQVDGKAHFCSACGAPMTAAGEGEAVALSFTYASSGVAIEFPESSAATFDEALEGARRAPDFQECLRAGKKWYLAAWPISAMEDVARLADKLSGIRNRKAYVDGQPMEWNELFGFAWCLRQRQSSFNATLYCFGADEKRFNPWGCKQLRMDWAEWEEWFSYGTFKGKDRFVFDKERIAHEVERAAHPFRFCPMLRKALIAAVLEELPNEVRILESDGWTYRKQYNEAPGAIKVVQKRDYGNGMTSTEEFYAIGAAPVGFGVAQGMLRSALKRCGVTDIDVDGLFR